jgi:hypothetical protein
MTNPDKQDEFAYIEKLKEENARLKKKELKREKWIEKDQKLANKPRTGRLVTKNDIEDPKFIKRYPKARIGDEICDPKPLFWKIGFKKKPSMEQTHAEVAAQFAKDFRENIDDDRPEELLTEFDDEEEGFTEAEVTAFLHASSMHDSHAQAQIEKEEQSAPHNAGEASPSPSGGTPEDE